MTEKDDATGKETRRGKRRWLFRALLLLLALVAGSLVAYLQAIHHLPQATPPERRVASPPPDVLARYRSDPALGLEATLDPETTDDGLRVLPGRLRVRRLEEPTAHDARFHFYFARGVKEKAATVVVTPILDGQNSVARIIARDLATHGMHAVIVDRYVDKQKDPTLLESTESGMRDLVADRLQVLEWVLRRPEVDPTRIGAYGVSLGGIGSLLLAAVEPRIRATVAVMAGGDPAAVMARPAQGECVTLARANGVPENATRSRIEAFERKARPVLVTCPVALARYIDPSSVLMFLTRRDTSVPSALQVRLRGALGRPEAFSLPTGHYSSVLYLPYIKSRARAFLAARLGVGADG